jgi:serine/threonine-protein kinase
MFTRDGRIKITDFGIALLARADHSNEFQVMGTPSYMSPEQTKGLNLTKQTDFFSLGIVLFELLAGKRPFQGRTLYELMDNIRYGPAPSYDLQSKLPAGLDQVIQGFGEETGTQVRQKEFARNSTAIKGCKSPSRPQGDQAYFSSH